MTSPQSMYQQPVPVQPARRDRSGWLRYVIAALVVGSVVAFLVWPKASTEPGSVAASASSSRSDPIPVGQVGRIASWSITFGATNTDAAAELAGADYLVDLEPGQRFVLAPLTIAYSGADAKAPNDLRFRFVGSAGNTFDGGFGCGIFKDDVVSVEPMFAGASEAARVCVPVPADQIDGGVWQVVELWDSASGVFFALR